MEYYQSFNTEALELAKKLPEEQSELYKRYFVPIPFESFEKQMRASDNSEWGYMAMVGEELSGQLGLDFDLVVGGIGYVSNKKSEFVSVVEMKDITEEQIMEKLFKSSEDKGVAFIHAYSERIIFINVPAAKKAELKILFVNSSAPLATQVIVNVGKEGSLSLFEWYGSRTKSGSLSAVLHEVRVGNYAKAEVNIVHNEDANTRVVGFAKGSVADNGHLKVNYVYNGGAESRVRNEIRAEGHNARSDVIEVVMGSAQQKFDLNTIIANLGKDTISDLESKAVLMDETVCLLKGFAKVGDNASGSRSFVNERGILLDKRAYMSSIPGMSINNSNVKATHSSATAPVDEELLFYLMSRGMDEKSAQKLLVSGFFSSSIAKMESTLARSAVVSLMNEKINTKRFGDTPKLDISSVWFDPKAVAAQGLFEGHYKYREL